MESETLFYKKRPLVRCKDDMFYGRVSESHVVLIHVDSKSDDDFKVPNKLSVGLIPTLAASKGNYFKPKKFSEKSSFFEALDLASAWLDRVESPKRGE